MINIENYFLPGLVYIFIENVEVCLLFIYNPVGVSNFIKNPDPVRNLLFWSPVIIVEKRIQYRLWNH